MTTGTADGREVRWRLLFDEVELYIIQEISTGPTARTPKPEYLISLGKVPFNFSWI